MPTTVQSLTIPTVPPTPPARRTRPAGAGGRVRWVVVLLTSLAVTGYFVGSYAVGSLATLSKSHVGLASTYADRPPGIQVAFYFHIVFAGLALALGPAQFSRLLRRRKPAVHRWIGRVYLVTVWIGAAAAFVMSFVSSVGFDGFFGFGSLALVWAWTAWRGYRSIRSGDIASHQAWMIRNFALTYAGVTLRLWLGILIGIELLFANGPLDFEHAYNTAYIVLPFLSWLPNLLVAEWLVRRRRLPTLVLSPSATGPKATRTAQSSSRTPAIASW